MCCVDRLNSQPMADVGLACDLHGPGYFKRCSVLGINYTAIETPKKNPPTNALTVKMTSVTIMVAGMAAMASSVRNTTNDQNGMAISGPLLAGVDAPPPFHR